MPIETTKESPAPVSGEWVMVPREDIEGIINAMRDHAENLNPSGGWPGSAFSQMATVLDRLLNAAPDRIARSRPTVAPPPVSGVIVKLGDYADSAYACGKRDGSAQAVQDIDLMTGGDGEYRVAVLFGGGVDEDRHCPDPEAMKARIVERFSALSALHSR